MTQDERHEMMSANFVRYSEKYASKIMEVAAKNVEEKYPNLSRDQRLVLIAAYMNAASSYTAGCLAEPV